MTIAVIIGYLQPKTGNILPQASDVTTVRDSGKRCTHSSIGAE